MKFFNQDIKNRYAQFFSPVDTGLLDSAMHMPHLFCDMQQLLHQKSFGNSHVKNCDNFRITSTIKYCSHIEALATTI